MLSAIEDLIADLREGKMIVLVDDENRENEGDLVMSAAKITAADVNFMATHGRGWICLTLTDELCRRFDLPPITARNEATFGTAFTVTIEAKNGVSTGISAADRARTLRLAALPDTVAADFVRPGHVQPICARAGGVLERAGQTEGSIDLMKIAGLSPAGVICEIMNPDGSMARLPELEKFCSRHQLKIGSVEQIARYRRRHEKLIACVSSAKLPTEFGDFNIHVYQADLLGETHVAVTCGDIRPGGQQISDAVPVRIHSECFTGDIFHSARCDCGEQLNEALRRLQKFGRGAVVYLRQEGRGIGLANKIKAYALQEQGLDTVDANVALGFAPDSRDYALGAQIFADLGIRNVRLLTNNPQKISALEEFGMTVSREPLEILAGNDNRFYLETKRKKMGHWLK